MVDENNGSQGISARKIALIAGMIAVLVAVVLLVLWIFSPDPPKEPADTGPPPIPEQTSPELEPEPEPEPAPPEERAPPPAEPEEPEEPLPPLAESDEAVREDVAQLPNGSQLLDMMVTDEVIRKVVRAVAAAEEGALVHKYRPVTDLQSRFTAEPVGEATGDDELPRYRLTEENYRRYDARINLLSSLDTDSIVALYQRYSPLLQEAYEEQGLVDNGSFHDVTLVAIDNMLAAPEIEGDVLLVQPSVMYKYADPELEALLPVQKLMVRMGPENARKLKNVLRRLKTALEAQNG